MTSGKPDFITSPVRQTDVARKAGVSTATVSRVLNGSTLVRSEVRSRVEAAIAELGYLPHEGARSLATRRTRTLGMIIPTLNNAIFAAGVNALEAEARDQGHGLVISVSNYDPVQETVLIRQMLERKVDGLALVGNDRTDEARDLLRSSGLRHVAAWTFDQHGATADIGFDNHAAMEPLVAHLMATGRRRIALLAGVTADNDRARARVKGIRHYLSEHGLALVGSREVRYSIRLAQAAFPDMLAHRPDAIICGNDVIAYGVLFAAQQAGIDVPDDIAVTGFDDLPMSEGLNLTTIAVPAAEMGRRAANELIRAAEEERAPESYEMQTTLVRRGTS
ncbi:MAG: LacI family DNA-binding transcriptional regulator [Pseudomonadota bacterium]